MKIKNAVSGLPNANRLNMGLADNLAAVFIADKEVNGIDELFVTFSDGSEIIKLSDTLVARANVAAFRISPDGIFVAYVADQDTAGLFELYVVPVDKTTDETAVKVSGTMAGNGILQLPSGKYVFGWAPDNSGVGYIADQDTITVEELFASLPNGGNNTLLSGTLVSEGGNALVQKISNINGMASLG